MKRYLAEVVRWDAVPPSIETPRGNWWGFVPPYYLQIHACRGVVGLMDFYVGRVGNPSYDGEKGGPGVAVLVDTRDR
jgi:hypothetical protein